MSLVLLLACQPSLDSEPDSGPVVDDSAPPLEQALVAYEGLGVLAEGTYDGAEALKLEREEDGGLLCHVMSTLITVGPADCPACDWAVELEVDEVTQISEAEPGCEALGIDPSELAGRRLFRGYQSEYLGHGDVLMVPIEGYWSAVAFADYEPETGWFGYRWEDGFVTY